MSQGSMRRLEHLEARYAALAERVPGSASKEVASVLHAMIQELWRGVQSVTAPGGEEGRPVPDVAELYKQAPKMEGPALNEPLPVGTPAPDFELPDAQGRPVRLADLRGRPVVLVFYPLDWSPGCSQQLDLYQSELEAFERRGARLLAVSVDSIYSHGAWAAVRGLGFPLLADFQPKGEVARRYGVYREPDGFSERALYVLDRDGIIRYATVSPQLHHVPDLYELFEALDALPGEASTASPASAAPSEGASA